MSTIPDLCTLADFARLARVKKSYVTKLKAAGRLVLAADGQVCVAASLALIDATRDPSKAGVAARHAAARDAAPEPEPETAPEPADDPSAPPVAKPARTGYQKSRALRERYLAKEAQRAYAVASGKLLDREEVTGAIAAAVTTLRQGLEGFAVTLGPLLAAETDEGRCMAMLAEEVERLLTEIAKKFAGVGKLKGDE